MFFASKKYVLRALKSAQEQEDKIDMVNSYDLLAKLEDKLGNYKEALNYFKLYTACSDSLYSEETRQKLEDIEAQYEAEKAENERLIKVLGKDQDVESVGKYTGYGILANTRTIIMMSIAGILLLTGILFWIKRR
jgi:cytochrome c-type biogenesis protein CcmH/NrfG